MAATLSALSSTFYERDPRLAVFDTEIRKHVGQWTLPDPVPTDDVLARFEREPEFVREDGSVIVPLHEADSADLTGEYLRYLPDHIVPCVVYHDFSASGESRLAVDELSRAYPAWRLRFWHPEFDPPSTPAYMDAGVGAAASRTGSPGAETDAVIEPPDSSPATAEEPLPDDGAAMLDDLQSMITEHEIATREEARSEWERLSIDQFVANRGGIPDLVPAGIERDTYGQQLVKLRVPRADDADPIDIIEDFGVYPDSEVLVDSQHDLAGFPAEAEVLDIQGRQLECSIYWDRGPENPDPSVFELESENRFVLGELLNSVPFDRKRRAVETISEDDRKRGWLSGSTTPTFDEATDATVSKSRLNDSQYRAAHTALRATDVFCIHGPPGTGKTRTLVEIIKAACENHDRVLAVSHSNQAVDNLLVGDSTPERTDPASIHSIVESTEITAARAGTNTANDFVAEEYADEDLYRSDVVCATTSGAHRFGENIFDVAVVDEATQASIPDTLIPATKADRLILAGDHKQLSPYHSSEDDEDEDMAISLFEHFVDLYGDDIVQPLDIQYRMNQAIAAFPNEQFYDGILSHGKQNRDWQISSFPPFEAIHVEGEEQQSPGRSYFNEREASLVAAEALDLLEDGVPASDIGIITPYSAQIGKIRVELADLWVDDTDEIKVATVDSFQGSERDAIIVSFVRSNPQGFSGFLTFPNEGPRRLNVALTRARRRCVLVGNLDTLRRRAPTKDPDESSADTYQALYEHLDARNLIRGADGGIDTV
jgi:hypothetical protein